MVSDCGSDQAGGSKDKGQDTDSDGEDQYMYGRIGSIHSAYSDLEQARTSSMSARDIKTAEKVKEQSQKAPDTCAECTIF